MCRCISETFSAELFSAADELIVSPGVALEEHAIAAAIKNGVSVCGDIDLFVREARAPIVAITGSNGKSTVTTLVGAMAEAAQRNVGVGGNLGTAALDLLGPARDLYVLELSSFQLERAQPLQAEVATVLNVSPDHMDRYPSVLAYHQAKHRIFRGCQQIVINRADPLSRPLVPGAVTQWSFGLDVPDFNGFGVRESHGERFLAFEHELLMPVRELKIAGDHNIANALAALALGHAVKLPMAAMLQTLREFTGLAHRCQLIAQTDLSPKNDGGVLRRFQRHQCRRDRRCDRRLVQRPLRQSGVDRRRCGQGCGIRRPETCARKIWPRRGVDRRSRASDRSAC